MFLFYYFQKKGMKVNLIPGKNNLTCEILLADLQMKPYRTDEFVHKLFYESARFTAFNNQWVVKAFINTKNQRDPTQCSDRDMKYQVWITYLRV
jgi:hypothetical protein